MDKLHIKSVDIYNGSGQIIHKQVDVLVEDGKIIEIGSKLTTLDGFEVYAPSKGIIHPGLIDLYAHSAEPGHEWIESLDQLAKSAKAGGFTSVAIAPDTTPAIDSAEVAKYVSNRGREIGFDFKVYGAISQELGGKKLAELIDLAQASVIGFTDGDQPVQNTDLMVKALQYAQHTGLPVCNRPEDQWLAQYGLMHEGYYSTVLGLKGIPAMAEVLMVKRDLDLLRHVGGRLHFHAVSTAAAVELIKAAKIEGLKVSASVAVNSLLYTDADLQGFDTNLKQVPVLRSAADQDELISGLADGTIDFIVSNHRALDIEQKRLEFDMATSGSITLQTMLSELTMKYPNIAIGFWIDKLCAKPANWLGQSATSIEVGAVANFAVFDQDTTWELNRASNFSGSYNAISFNKLLKGRHILSVHHKNAASYGVMA